MFSFWKYDISGLQKIITCYDLQANMTDKIIFQYKICIQIILCRNVVERMLSNLIKPTPCDC